LLGFTIVLGLVIAAAITPFLPIEVPTALSNDTYAAPSEAHIFGTDHLGRDVFSGVMWGAQVSLLFGVVVALLSGFIGTLLGTIPGYYGGLIDDVFSRFFELFIAIPALVLIIVIVTLFGAQTLLIMLVVGLTIWPSNAKIMRAQVLSLKHREYITASHAAGAGDVWVMRKHIIPNAIQPVIANATLQMAGAIVLEASLSFLGLGDPNVISWGRMLRIAQTYYFNAWWMAFFPGIAIFLAVLGFTLVGDAVNRALNPRSRTLVGLR
jgi:peptide/nickel transport system permease protein